MAQPAAVQHLHLEGVYSLLDDLQAGFLLIDPEGQIIHASSWLRRLLPRRLVRGSGKVLLGDALYEELCDPVLSGTSSGQRWRELELDGRDEGVKLHVSVRSTRVEFADKRNGVLLSLYDVSSEVGLHKQNKALLKKQKQINANLRSEIAKQLREHEDDISQLNEILQIAPAIFASFVAEAGRAIEQVEVVLADEARDEEGLVETLRDLHTLKGNARSLGLNYIGGRAHSVEDLLMVLQKEAPANRSKSMGDLADLVEDLRRAKNRASFVRSRLVATSAEPTVDLDLHGRLTEALEAIRAAAERLPESSPALLELRRAEELVHESCQRELQELFEFLKAAVSKVSQNLAADCPFIDTSGGNIKVGARAFSALAIALPHIVRNAVSHGIESAQARLEQGKAPVGCITIAAQEQPAEGLRITIRDDGRGIDRAKLRALAAELGLDEPQTESELAAVLLHPGVSTSEATDLDSGRGMGSTAANEAVIREGGSITLRSTPGEGTTFTVHLPLLS